MDIDSDDERNDGNEVDLTGFLFGNIDSEGRLVDDFFDPESRKHIASLSRLGLNSLLHEVIQENDDSYDGDEEGSNYKTESKDDEENFEIKDDNAIDYSDINELAEDIPETVKTERLDDEGLNTEGHRQHNIKNEPRSPRRDERDSDSDKRDDKDLMPPPSLPVRSVSQDSVKSGDEMDIKSEKDANERKLDTPLAAMLPSKYANIDVRELFPDFRPDKVLRFSRLFGPGKPSSLPQIWRSVRRKRRRRKHSREHQELCEIFNACEQINSQSQ